MCRSTNASRAVFSTSIARTMKTQNIIVARAAMSNGSAIPTSITAKPETQCTFMLRWLQSVRSTPSPA